MRRRLDAELVRRGLARSRDHAVELIASGHVRVQSVVASKPASQVDEHISITVDESVTDQYVSRGAHKLIGALDAFGISVEGRRALDAGASTGGFTQVLLERGARAVAAVDVGYGQLAWVLRSDPRVHVRERLNVRSLVASDLPFAPDLVVADLSFISLTTVLPALTSVADPAADLVLMVKPQFEAGREAVGPRGVVTDPATRAATVLTVAQRAGTLGWGTAGVVASPLPGPQGNVEYFLWLRRDAPGVQEQDVHAAVEEGPA